MVSLHVFLLMFAFVLAAISAFWNPPRVHLGWLGFALFALAALLP